MPIEPVKIPQNVYVEDRIVGPVTLRQLIILLVSGGFSYALWTGVKTQTGYASIPLTILCWIPFVIGLAFSFIRIQSISLLRFLLLMLEKLDKPQIRTWTPRRGITINFQYATKPVEEKPKSALEPHRQKLEELSALLDQGPITAQAARNPESDAVMGSPEYRPVDPQRVSVSALEDARTFDDIRESQETPTVPRSSEPSRIGTLLDLLPPKPNNS